MKVKWTPDIHQDVDALTSQNSPFYSEKLTNKIIEQYGSIENFKSQLQAGTNFPLKAFTSYDGVDIMIGEPFFYFNHGIEQFNAITESKGATIDDENYLNEEFQAKQGKVPMKFFSSLQAIEEYIMMLEPCISIQDLNKWMNEDNEFNGIRIEDLLEIVKTRI